MEVAATGRQEAPAGREVRHAHHGSRLEASIVDLDARQAPALEAGDIVDVVGGRRRMGEDGQAARVTDGIDRGTGPDPLSRHVRGPAIGQPAIERVLDGCRVAGQNERLADVGTPA